MHIRPHHIITFFCYIFALSCTNRNCENGDCDHDYLNIIKNWTGKEIIIPSDYKYQIKDQYVDYDFEDADYKIITYIDSTGCHSCHMQLPKWDKAIGELKSIPDVSLNFLMILNSQKEHDTYRLLRIDDFRHPIVIDRDNAFAGINTLPVDETCHTFLLNSENKILAIGNPALNPKTMRLYKKIISGKDDNQATESYDNEETKQVSFCNNPAKALGIIRTGETASITYELYNNDSITVHIEDIVPSCGCIKASSSTDAIHPGEYALVNVEVTPTETSADYQQQIDIYYREFEHPESLTIYGFVK